MRKVWVLAGCFGSGAGDPGQRGGGGASLGRGGCAATRRRAEAGGDLRRTKAVLDDDRRAALLRATCRLLNASYFVGFGGALVGAVSPPSNCVRLL